MGKPGGGGSVGCRRARAWMLVFSSADKTNSSSRSGCPCQIRSYRSRMRPAFAANGGSRGKIQQRCCQGRMASSGRQRQIVVPLMVATSPDRLAWAANSIEFQRDSGTPDLEGSSQAKALMATMTSGGKCAGTAPTRPFFQTLQTPLEETLSPLGDDFSSCIQALRNLIVGQALGGQENHLGTLHLEIRQRIFACAFGQFLVLFLGQDNLKWTLAWHLCGSPVAKMPTNPVSINIIIR